MINEFRKDLVSGDWVLISSMREQRPHSEEHVRLHQDVKNCVFEPEKLDGIERILEYELGTIVIPNKFPAVTSGPCGQPVSNGLFMTHAANGYHELVITRDHEKHFAQFTTEETAEVLRAYRDRYMQIANDDCGAYVSIFHNHGAAAGASVYHNHSQIISTPIVPPEVLRSIEGADDYFQQNGIQVHQAMIDWEIKQGTRIVYENNGFIAFCPFVSKIGYEIRIFPKQQSPYFEKTSDADLLACADTLNAVLKKLFIALDNVDYNFYIHTAPVDKDPAIDYDFYHWHLEVVPRIPIAAGFELSTAIYINPFDPDDCAKKLRETKI